jgi:peptidoglycan/LPS O-acetylase OafA/YrhL
MDSHRAEPALQYRPDIDGLRAIAVLSVILFHATGRTGGFVGVDIFFVISGFLIARILFREVDESRISIARFYERRIRRIVPALTAMMVIVVAAFAVIATPIDFKSLAQSAVATALFASNIYFLLKSDYFDPSAEGAPLLHTWSLAVEEQYYLVFPLLVMWIGRSGRRVPVLAGLLVASLLLSIVVTSINATQAFYLPVTRFWELLIGAMIASLPAPRLSPRAVDAIAALGLVSIGASIVFFWPGMSFPGATALVPCLGAAALIFSGQTGGGRVHRIVAARPMVFVGLISYSLYLWHWPILVGARYVAFRALTPVEIVAALAAMFAMACLSWRFVEVPFRIGRASRGRIFAITAAIGAVTLAFGIGAQVTGGFPRRLPEPARGYAAAALDTNPRRAECDRPASARVVAGQACQLGADGVAPNFALIGDSFADALMPGIEDAARRVGRRGYALFHSGCFPFVGVKQDNPACREASDAVLAFLKAHPEITTVIVSARWTSALLGNRYGQLAGEGWFIEDEQSYERSYAENARVFPRALDRMLGDLAPARIVLLAHIPEQRYDVPRALALSSEFGFPNSVDLPVHLHQARQAELRLVLAAAAARHPKVEIIDVGALMCGETCPVRVGSNVLYVDDNHLSRAGAVSIAARVKTSLFGEPDTRLGQ